MRNIVRSPYRDRFSPLWHCKRRGWLTFCTLKPTPLRELAIKPSDPLSADRPVCVSYRIVNQYRDVFEGREIVFRLDGGAVT